MSEIFNNQVMSVHGDALNLPKVNVPIKDYDTVTIKHISYSGSNAIDTIYMLWCTYTNSFVTSFIIDAAFTHNNTLDTIIRLNKSNFDMSFKLHYFDPADGNLKPSPDIAIMSITLEFNKYKK